jgi:hypothetical protein
MKHSGFINSDVFGKISKENIALKTQDNLLIRICLFVLGSIVYGSICGVLALFMSGVNNFDESLKVMVFVYAILGFVTTELFLIKEFKFFGNGLDDAAILGMQLSLASAAALLTDGDSFTIGSVIALTSVFCYLRYLNIPSLIIGCFSCTYVLANFMLDFIKYGKSLLPFILIFFAVLIYFASKKIEQNIQKTYYAKGLVLIKSFCLILFYLAGNYFVVRSLSYELREDYALADSEIPFSWFFWVSTFLVPTFYLVFGIKNRDKIILWVGFFALGFSFYSFRVYHHVLPPEVALTLGGLLLFLVAYFAIKKLKNKEEGITFKADRFQSSNSLLQLEVLASAAQFGIKPEVAAPESPMEFGGGGYSGGGSGGEF